MLRTLTSVLLTPPAINILIILTGWLISRYSKRFASSLILLGAVSLWLLSTPIASSWLHQSIEDHEALAISKQIPGDPQAIILLGAAQFDNAAEFDGQTTPTPDALGRLHYAAYLHKNTNLPLMTTGGPMNQQQDIHADILATALGVYGVDVKWREQRSATTWQNALFSAETLLPLGVKRVVLVTHSYHMRRAVMLYELAGFKVTAAPTQLSTNFPLNEIWFWLPNARSLQLSHSVLHEYLGLLWYRFRSPEGHQGERNYRLQHF